STQPSSPVVTDPGDSIRRSRSCSGRPRLINSTHHFSIGAKTMKAAIYARVSTEKQGRDQPIDSQLDALRRWATAHGHELKDDHIYIDEGYSGARLDRPALDRLRDAAREGEFDVLGVYSPDRLARRSAYQVLLLEELRKAACAVEFIERPISDDPHDQLLLQI